MATRYALVCSRCGGATRIIVFITDRPTVRDILVQLGEATAPPRIAPTRSPLWWEATGAEHDPSTDALPQPAFEFDQRVTWVATAIRDGAGARFVAALRHVEEPSRQSGRGRCSA